MSESTPNAKNESDEIIEDVEKFIKSRSSAAIGVIGKAAMFDTRSHSNHDFTAGGRLETRWVNNDRTSIAKRKQQGFAMPSEVSPRFPNHEMKNQVLMLIPKEKRAALRAQVANLTARYEGGVFNKDLKGRAAKMEQFSVTEAGTDKPTTPGVISPAPTGPSPKKVIGAK